MPRTAAALPLLVLIAGCDGETTIPPVEPDATDCAGVWQPIRDRLQHLVDSLGLSGGVVRISVAGRVACIAATGSLSVTQAIEIQSGTKWLTAAAVLSLLGAGLELDGPIAQRLPSFGAKPAISLRQVLSQTAGLPADVNCLAHGSSLAACVDHIGANVPLEEPPGTVFRYGSTSFAVAGRLAEVASGRGFIALFQQRIAGPLGFGAFGWDSPALPLLSGGASASVEDYGRFVEMLAMNGVYRGTRLLSAAAIAAMRQDHTTGLAAVNPPRSAPYGLGSWVDSADMSSCPGSFGFLPWVDFARRIGSVVYLPDDLNRSVAGARSIVALAGGIVTSLQ